MPVCILHFSIGNFSALSLGESKSCKFSFSTVWVDAILFLYCLRFRLETRFLLIINGIFLFSLSIFPTLFSAQTSPVWRKNTLKERTFDYHSQLNSFSLSLLSLDQTSLNTTHEADVSVCRENETTWLSLMSSKSTTTYVFDCVLDCLIWLFNGRDPALPSDDRRKAWPALPDELAHAHHIQLLVTGSFRLMGATLKALGPKIVQVVPPDDEIE